MLSATITDKSGRTLSGQTIEAFYTSVEHARPLSVGINCALGAAEMRPLRRGAVAIWPPASSAATRTPACPTPSASTTRRPRPPPACSREFAESGFVNIVGGCCGTTPEHIAAIARAVEGLPPRSAEAADRPTLRLSGLERLEVTPGVQLHHDR